MPALYVAIAVAFLLLGFAATASYVLATIAQHMPGARERIERWLMGTEAAPLQKQNERKIRETQECLAEIVFSQQAFGESSVELDGSFVEGYDSSVFELIPGETAAPQWTTPDFQVLSPRGLRVTVKSKSPDREPRTIASIQLGLVVLQTSEGHEFAKFSGTGFQSLNKSFHAWRQKKPAVDSR